MRPFSKEKKEIVSRWAECLCNMNKAFGLLPSTKQTGYGGTQKVEVGGYEVEGHHWLTSLRPVGQFETLSQKQKLEL